MWILALLILNFNGQEGGRNVKFVVGMDDNSKTTWQET